jgi:drug/metabolite transporter (DMT)-like permease
MTPSRYAFPAMLAGSVCLAFGPWFVRLADVGAVQSAFWRMALAAGPIFAVGWWAAGRSLGGMLGAVDGRRLALGLAALAGFFFAADLAIWHLGIKRTTLANAALLSNSASFLLPIWGMVVLRHKPGPKALAAMGFAIAGTVLLLGRSADLSARHLAGDVMCLGAALFYTAYLLVIDRLRGRMATPPLLGLATLSGALCLLPMALLAPGAFWPQDWTPIVLLALGSQVIGQGLVVYAVGHLRPLVVGLTLLVQPAIAATIGALRFGETPGPVELAGAALVVVALVLVRLPDRALELTGEPAA